MVGWASDDPRPAARTGEGRSNIFLIPLYVWEGEGPAPSEEEEEEGEGGAKRQMGGIRRPPDIFRPSVRLRPSGWVGAPSSSVGRSVAGGTDREGRGLTPSLRSRQLGSSASSSYNRVGRRAWDVHCTRRRNAGIPPLTDGCL